MRIFDIFKKKKPSFAKATEGKEEKVEARPLPKAIKKKVSDRAAKTLYSAHVTEKATSLERNNKYIFKVLAAATKPLVKKAIEDLYGVEVVRVKIINVPRKKRRLGRYQGWRKGYKKAIVEIKKGQKIEIMPR